MTTTTNAPETKMTPLVRTMGDALVNGGNITGEGLVTFGTNYEEQAVAHTGQTIAVIKAIQKFDAQYCAAVHVAQGELAIPFFQENKDIAMVSSKQQCGLDRLAVRTHHSKSYPVPGTDRVVTNYCQTAVIFDKYAGPFAKEAKLFVQAKAAELLK